ncbi:excalibur calcium-binding domain-containing protein [Luteimonas sp. YGD11-2]|uniref:excalibur calcium-binding domain-containing protein n=1 Tax=Luteimonas sp. YGD11-2 TaxID=2508168 RepID=UPI00100B80C3|nr:excalibur calcium-binding domain-containing protein [Luteimonas sp. YGD11-2]
MRFLIVLLLIAAAWGGYRHFHAPVPEATPTAAAAPARADPAPVMRTPAQRFSCDGRQHCSQMRSCEEATFFIRNCPNTKMDGDGDGVPCESQWCG